jgi:hypothetical protein
MLGFIKQFLEISKSPQETGAETGKNEKNTKNPQEIRNVG